MNRHLIQAYYIGCKLAALNNSTELATELSKLDDSDSVEEAPEYQVKSTASKMVGDEQYRKRDTWGHKVELFMPSNMGVPSR
jgi:hypothetical protein